MEIAGEFRGSIDAIKLVVPHGYVHYQKAKYERLVLHEGGYLPLNGVGAQENQADNIEAAQVPFEEQAHVHVVRNLPRCTRYLQNRVAVAAEQEDTAEEKKQHRPLANLSRQLLQNSRKTGLPVQIQIISARATTSRNQRILVFQQLLDIIRQTPMSGAFVFPC